MKVTVVSACAAVASAFAPFVREVRGLNSDGRAVKSCERCFGSVLLDNLECFRKGKPLQGVIDFQRGY